MWPFLKLIWLDSPLLRRKPHLLEWVNNEELQGDLFFGFQTLLYMQTMILLDDVYTLFDSIARGYDVCKIGTIGDAYIVVNKKYGFI
jgi:hypothetical protein